MPILQEVIQINKVESGTLQVWMEDKDLLEYLTQILLVKEIQEDLELMVQLIMLEAAAVEAELEVDVEEAQ
jgi:hypothetical protein